ncbi:hypothetical protein [Mucilaginibacter glaciei]|uniref:Uncharacterized protein n=1 Tax=Mucilaginibacter glaciei TaxID=2772109 RepID=A0A926NMI1_9SPHI|nr:hypothetical protein [Mucilaginibacter glaciei]MBD1394829.1 hypothetical protein [Mucilaginibacter glaciei]
MKRFNENETVIYTDSDGRNIDTFVVFETDMATGITHINHMDMKVQADALRLHPGTIEKYNLPMVDAFSFEIFKKLKDKYGAKDVPSISRDLKTEANHMHVLKQAS